MNCSILFQSFSYVSKFTLLASLSKNIYKYLRMLRYTDHKFAHAFMIQDTEVVTYLAKFVVHKNILSPDYLHYKLDYDTLCLFKKIGLTIMNDYNQLSVIESLHNADLFEFLTDDTNLIESFSYLSLSYNIVFYIIDKISDQDEVNIRYINVLKRLLISCKQKDFALNTMLSALCHHKKMQTCNYEFVHFVMKQNNKVYTKNLINYPCCRYKDIGAVDVIASYGSFEIVGSQIYALIHINDMTYLEYLISKGFIIKFTTSILITAMRRYIGYVRFILKHRNFEFDRHKVIINCCDISMINLLTEYEFNFSSDNDDVFVYYVKNRQNRLIRHLVETGVKINNISTYKMASTLEFEKYKSIWTACNDPDVLLMLIEESRYKILKYLVQERNLTHPDAYDLAKKLNKSAAIRRLLKN